MSKISDGGPAFPGGLYEPQHGGSNDREPMNDGMSLLDWFAGQALPGIVSRIPKDRYPHAMPWDAASMAYAVGAAMLAERAKRIAKAEGR